MDILGRKTVTANFTNEELELLIDASLNDRRIEEACKLLRKKFRGEGYISGDEIAYWAYELDKEKYNWLHSQKATQGCTTYGDALKAIQGTITTMTTKAYLVRE